MEEKICYYCGTKYPKDADCCPLCGQKETVAEEIDEIPADLKSSARAKSSEQAADASPRRGNGKEKNVLATLLCIILALAVVACALWILHSIGILSFPKAPAEETSLQLPVETPPELPAAEITGIRAIPENMRFSAVGQKNRVRISYIPESITAGDPSLPISYTSADPAVASVTDDGEVAAEGEGETIISVNYGEFTAECAVVCVFAQNSANPPEKPDNTTESDTQKPSEENPAREQTEENPPQEPSSSFSLSLTDFTLSYAGEKAKISAQNTPDGAEVTWNSKNESVAVVTGGVVTAVAPGTTTVTATCNGETLSCIVRCSFAADTESVVTQTSDGVEISHTDVTLSRSDESFKISLRSGGADVSDVNWSTSDAAVCTVDADGTVHAVGAGNAKIIASHNGNSYTCIIRCSF